MPSTEVVATDADGDDAVVPTVVDIGPPAAVLAAACVSDKDMVVLGWTLVEKLSRDTVLSVGDALASDAADEMEICVVEAIAATGVGEEETCELVVVETDDEDEEGTDETEEPVSKAVDGVTGTLKTDMVLVASFA